MKKAVSLILCLCLITAFAPGALGLKTRAKTLTVDASWSVLLPESPTEYESYAAGLLSDSLAEAFGTPVETTASPRGNYIALGAAAGVDVSGMAENGYRIKAIDGNIHIAGTGNRGLQAGVCRFLEEYFGRKVYTADITVIPETDGAAVPADADVTYEPFFEYADTDWLSPCDADYSLANGLTGGTYRRLSYEMGGSVDYIGGFCHTMGGLCETAKYAESHPEYLALHDGERTTDQPCLTNPDVLEIATKNVMKILEEKHDPDAPLQIVSVTQNDNFSFCECETCKAFEATHGGAHSATVLNFANQIADTVKAAGYDNVAIDTFAYLYSQSAPEGIVPRDNVIVRLCSIFCCSSHPFDSLICNEDFMRDLENWSKLSDRLYVWDYATNYSHTCCVYPDFGVLQRNIQILYEHNVKGVYVEGNYYVRSCDTEFAELRAYMISKCLQDPYCDLSKEVDGFLDAYYGPGGKFMRKIIDLYTLHAGSYDGHMVIYYGSWACMRPISSATAELIDGYWAAAKCLAETDDQLANINRSELSWRWYKSCGGKCEFSFFSPKRGDENEKLYHDLLDAGVTVLYEAWEGDIREIDPDVIRYCVPDRWKVGAENDPNTQKMIKYNKLAEKFPPLFGFFAFFQCMNVS